MLLSFGEPAAAVDGKRASRVKAIRRAMTEQVAVKPFREVVSDRNHFGSGMRPRYTAGSQSAPYIQRSVGLLSPAAVASSLLVWQQHEKVSR